MRGAGLRPRLRVPRRDQRREVRPARAQADARRREGGPLRAARVPQDGQTRTQPGSYMPSIAPYGYQIDRKSKTLTAHPEHAPVVRDIYKWAARENLGAPAIANRLNERGVPIPSNAEHEYHRSKHGWHQSFI